MSGIGIHAIGAAEPVAMGTGHRAIYARYSLQTTVFACHGSTADILAVAAAASEQSAIYARCVNLDAIWQRQRGLDIQIKSNGGKEDGHMYTHIHGTIEMRSGERAELVFNITDHDGATVDLTEASAEYRVARRAGEAALMVCTSEENGGIVMTGSAATVTVDTNTLAQGGKPLMGDFFAQLRITLDERMLIVAEGVINVAPVIGPAA